MLTTKQKLEKLLKMIREVDGQNSYSVLMKNEIVGYLESWIDDLPDEDSDN